MDRAGAFIPYTNGVTRVIEEVMTCREGKRKVMFIGNGGSAAVAGHFALDYWHAAGVRSISFLDGPQLTCLSNDHGYVNAYARSVENFSDPGDLLVAISSSGKSQNILNAVQTAREKGCGVVTLSGFFPSNPLGTLGDINFYVPSRRYGPVESAHEYILHAVLDVMVARLKGHKRERKSSRGKASVENTATP